MRCEVSGVRCQVSHVMFHRSPFKIIFSDNAVKLVVFGGKYIGIEGKYSGIWGQIQ